ncbi:hypothetical protein [Paenibacillus oryzisoli]|uniref:Uncharacterized protein n=1 Tax=Paenibacillus oryzisoli TaxID=1850517 RepID=A0A198AFB3_9BACL|nr:hypothetical protein [Paenibacillus oryzisoli]OAS19726.1 hypothetical protein A8708_26240 [Paenibacillus oryzisoli]
MESKKKEQKNEIEVIVKPIINVNVNDTPRKTKRCCSCSGTVNSYVEEQELTLRIQICPNGKMEGSLIYFTVEDGAFTSNSVSLPKCYTSLTGDTVLEVSGTGYFNFLGITFQGPYALTLVERQGATDDIVMFSFVGLDILDSANSLMGSINVNVPDGDLTITPCSKDCSCGSSPPVPPTNAKAAAAGKMIRKNRLVIVKGDGQVITH